MNEQAPQIQDIADDGIVIMVSWSEEGRHHRDRVAARLRVIADMLDDNHANQHLHGEVTR